MKLLVFILNKTEKLDRLLKTLAHEHITGATVINSSGMASQLSQTSDESLNSIFGSLRMLLKDNQKENKTIMMVVKEEKIPEIERIINEVVGNINEPNTGILFTVPIDFIRGYKQ